MKLQRGLALQLLEVATNGLEWSGVGFIIYGTIAALTGEPWPPLEKIAGPLSSALTLVGTAMTAASVYVFSPNAPPPELKSTKITAPIVILACIFGLATLAWIELSPVIVNGFAILGLAGALFRLRPNPGPRSV